MSHDPTQRALEQQFAHLLSPQRDQRREVVESRIGPLPSSYVNPLADSVVHVGSGSQAAFESALRAALATGREVRIG